MPLFVLLATFLFSLLLIKLMRKPDYALAGRIAMSAMLLFTAVGHFIFTEGMAMMLPPFIPCKTEVVYLTGLIEIAAAIGLLIPRFQSLTARLLIVFFILILPANIYASLEHVNYQEGTYEGNGPAYLWFRVPLQVLFIAWVYLSSIRK